MSDTSENSYRQALVSAEMAFGLESAEAGLCLIDLGDCLERMGKFDEAEAVEERYRSILCKLAREQGITPSLMQQWTRKGNNISNVPYWLRQ